MGRWGPGGGGLSVGGGPLAIQLRHMVTQCCVMVNTQGQPETPFPMGDSGHVRDTTTTAMSTGGEPGEGEEAERGQAGQTGWPYPGEGRRLVFRGLVNVFEWTDAVNVKKPE